MGDRVPVLTEQVTDQYGTYTQELYCPPCEQRHGGS